MSGLYSDVEGWLYKNRYNIKKTWKFFITNLDNITNALSILFILFVCIEYIKKSNNYFVSILLLWITGHIIVRCVAFWIPDLEERLQKLRRK